MWLTRALLPLSCLIAVALLLSACGSSPKDKAEQAAEIYLEAFNKGDGTTACAQLTVRGEQNLRQLYSSATGSTPSSCEEAVEAGSKLQSTEMKEAAEKVKGTGEACFQSADKAIVTIKNAFQSPTVVRDGEEWRIDEFGEGKVYTELHCQEPPKS